MLYKCPAQEVFNIDAWWSTTLDNCHFDDAIWGYTIRAFNDWKNWDLSRWNDPVLDDLFIMGLLDWIGENHRYAQSIQSMRFTLVLGSQLKMELVRLEDLVWLPSLLSFGTTKIDDASSSSCIGVLTRQGTTLSTWRSGSAAIAARR